MRFKLVNILSGRTAARRQDELGVPREPDIFTQLDQYVGKSPGGGLPYFMHLTHADKIGVNPKQHYRSTPLGVYFYPITASTIETLRRGNGLYRMDANMRLFVVQARNPEKVLVLQKESGSKSSPGTFLYEKLKAQAISLVSPGQKDATEYEKPYNEYSARELRSRPGWVHNYDKSDFEPASALIRGLLSIEERLTRRAQSGWKAEGFLLEWLTSPDSVGFPVTYGLNIRVQTPNGEGVVQDSYVSHGDKQYEVRFSDGEIRTYERNQLKPVPMTLREWVLAVKSMIGLDDTRAAPFADERAFIDASPAEQNQALGERKSGKYEMRRIEHKVERRPPNRNIVAFATALLRAGYEGVYDPGLGIIHRNEPEQAVFFGSRYYDVVAQLTTPSSKSLARKTPDEKSVVMTVWKYKSQIKSATDISKHFQLVADMLSELTPLIGKVDFLATHGTHRTALYAAKTVSDWFSSIPVAEDPFEVASNLLDRLKTDASLTSVKDVPNDMRLLGLHFSSLRSELASLTSSLDLIRFATKTDFDSTFTACSFLMEVLSSAERQAKEMAVGRRA